MTTEPMRIIKRQGERPTEEFLVDKLHDSIRAACLCVASPEGEAQIIARRVGEVVSHWCQSKPTVTSDDIRRVASRALETFHPEAAYLYQNHQLVL